MAESVTLGVNYVLGYGTCRGVAVTRWNILSVQYSMTGVTLFVLRADLGTGGLRVHNPLRGAVSRGWYALCHLFATATCADPYTRLGTGGLLCHQPHAIAMLMGAGCQRHYKNNAKKQNNNSLHKSLPLFLKSSR